MEVQHIKTIREYHQLRGLPSPKHPLISLVDYSKVKHPDVEEIYSMQEFYSIALKRNIPGKFRYGQSAYDFDGGVMSFFAPRQILRVKNIPPASDQSPSGWMLFIHPDFLWNTHLAKIIQHYDFFHYATTEALFLSEDEEKLVMQVFQHIHREYHANLDGFSKKIMIAQIEVLLSYAERFYKRQFITREKPNHELLMKLENLLNVYFSGNDLADKGQPSVQWVASEMNLSPNYLSTLLKQLSGRSTQQYIHEKLIESAKILLSSSNQTVSEIAYQLGFDHPESFSKLFKKNTGQTPLTFRAAFN